jgi:hypothetical protein
MMTRLYKAWLAVGLLVLTASGAAPTTPTHTGPTVTAPGTPVGAPVTQTIGPAGGTMQTADGKIKITFPAGAVASDTQFTLQPLTHALRNGVGLAYELSPQNVKLEKPIRIRLRVSAGDRAGASASMGLALQDDRGAWFALKGAQVTTATVRAAQTDDSWVIVDLASLLRERRLIKSIGAYADLRLTPSNASVRKGQSITLHVTTCEPPWDAPDSLLTPLHCGPPRRNADALHASAGQLSQTSPGELRYTAPGKIPSPNPVTLSVTYGAVGGRARVILVGSVRVVDQGYSGQLTYSYTVGDTHQGWTVEGRGNITLTPSEDGDMPDVASYNTTGGSFEFTYTLHGCLPEKQNFTLPVRFSPDLYGLEVWKAGSARGKVYIFFPVSESRIATFQCPNDKGELVPVEHLVSLEFSNHLFPLPYTDETVLEATDTPVAAHGIFVNGFASWRLLRE